MEKDNVHVIEFQRELIDVTSNHRPDLDWLFIDSNGHYHHWYEGDILAVNYVPSKSYHVPSIEWVKTGVDFYPDGSEYEVGFNRCKLCGEEVEPGYKADTTIQYISGPTHCYIDGKEISYEEVMKLFKRSFNDYSRMARQGNTE